MILIAGGSGFVGKEVVASLLESGYRVRILSRRGGGARKWGCVAGAEFVEGDIGDKNLPTRQEVFCGVTAIINCVGIIAETQSRTFSSMHVDGVENLVEAAKRHGIARFVHLSAMGAREHAETQYHSTKWLGEEALKRSGLDWTVFRASLIFGENDQFSNRIATMITPPMSYLHLGMFPVFGKGDVRFQPVCVKDVASCMVSSLADDASVGQTFDLCGESKTFVEIFHEICRAKGLTPTHLREDGILLPLIIPPAILFCGKPILFHLPVSAAHLMAIVVESVSSLLNIEPLLTRTQVTMLQEEHVGDGAKTFRHFNIVPVPLEEGLAK